MKMEWDDFWWGAAMFVFVIWVLSSPECSPHAPWNEPEPKPTATVTVTPTP